MICAAAMFVIGVGVGLVWGKWPEAPKPEEKKKDDEHLGKKLDVLA